MNIRSYKESIFESIKHIDEWGNEYWYARELQKVLGYTQWRRFDDLINRAKEACINSNYNISEQLANVGKLSKRANNAIVKINDYKLSRYICYLIVQNGDSRKEVIALGQTYFAIQTRKQELIENNYENLNENQKRIYNRNITKRENHLLNQTAKNSGVKNFDKFHNSGYKGLYNGETADDIARRKKLRYREDILDNMGSEELGANIFRITQIEAKLKNENIKTEKIANKTHFEVGKKIRQTIKELGGTYPEKLLKPDKSLKEILKNNKKTLE